VDQLTAQLAEMEKRLQQAKSERLPLPRSEHLCEDVIGEVYDIAASLEPFLTGDEQKWLHDSLKQVDSEAQELAAMIPGREVENAEQPQQVEGSAGPSVLPDPPLPAHEDVDSCPNSSARDDVEADRDTVCPACKSSLAQAESPASCPFGCGTEYCSRTCRRQQHKEHEATCSGLRVQHLRKRLNTMSDDW